MENSLSIDAFHFDQEDKSRLDKCLSERFPNHSRSYFQHLIEKKKYLLIKKLLKNDIL